MQVDGGPNYYAQFSNPLPTSPDFFPIGVWGAYAQEPENLDTDAAVGINTYVWAADNTYIPNIRADGRFHVIQYEGDRPPTLGSETAGWLLGDELDMTEGGAACPDNINAIKNGLPADGRFRYANYGKGVLIWGATGFNGHNDATSACYINAQDVTSTDLYWHTDPNESDQPQYGHSWGYGWSMERMRMLDAMDGVRKPQWGFVEVTGVMNDADPITPAQIRGAVWHTLIAGGRGIIYFQHDFDGSCITHHALREAGTQCYGAIVTMVTSVDAQIKQLAPVLNAPTVATGVSNNPAIRAMVKWQGGNFYVFAASMDTGATQGTVNIPCVGNATATVLGENRSVPMLNGSFSDAFANGDAVHIYRVDGGSHCGLS